MKKTTSKYKVVLKTVNKRYAKEADTILGGLNAIGLTWNQIKAKGEMTIYKDKLSYSHFFTMIKLKRIFGNKLVKQLWAKRLELLLNSTK